MTLGGLHSLAAAHYERGDLAAWRDGYERFTSVLAEHSLAFNRATIGKDTKILIDRKGRLPGQMIGKSPWLQSVFVETDASIGEMLDVTVTQALPNSLGGVLRTAKAA